MRREHPMRRNVVAVIAGLIMLPGVPAHAGNPQMRVTLLGTAGPEYFPDRLES